MALLDIIAGVLKPLSDAFDHVTVDATTKAQLQAAAAQTQANVAVQVLDYEKQLLTAQSNIIVAEAQGGSWIQRNWRPITMLSFLGLVICDSFGWLPNKLAPEAWTLLQIGIGGYTVGRSLEKVAVPAISALRAAR